MKFRIYRTFLILFFIGATRISAMEAPVELELSRKRAAEPSSEPSAKRIIRDDNNNNAAPMSLHEAAANPNSEILRNLLQNHPDVNVRRELDGATPLHIAAFTGQRGNVKLLLQAGAEVNCKNKQGASPLHFASLKDFTKVSELLINAGAFIDDQVGNHMTPLHTAARQAHFGSVRLLLERGASIDIQSGISGKTALYVASEQGSSAIVELLLYYNADITIADKNGRTAGSIALNSVIRRMLQEVATKKSIILPATLAVETNLWRLYKAIFENNSAVIFSLVQQTGVNIEGLPPLHLAVTRGNSETVKALITAGASLEHTTIQGNTPLHIALFQNHIEIAHILIDVIVTTNRPLLDKKNKNNVTPLMVAAHISLPTTIPIIERLLDLKVDQTGYMESLPPFMRAILKNRESKNPSNE